jgi:hypothetical protein
MSKKFEVLALVTKKEYIVIKAKDGYEAMESVEKDFFSDDPNYFAKNISRIDVRSAVEINKNE